MKTNIFDKLNRSSLIIFLLLFIVFIVNGLLQLGSLQYMYREMRFYEETAQKARAIQLLLQKQLAIWKNIIIDEESPTQYHTYYYLFSKYSSEIEDSFFNLRLKFGEDQLLLDKITSVLQSHKLLNQRSVGIIFTLPQMNKQTIFQAVSNLEQDNQTDIDNMEKLIELIVQRVNEKMAQIQITYTEIGLISLSTSFILFLFLIIRFIKVNTKTQREIVALSNYLNSFLPPQLVVSILQRSQHALKTTVERRFLTVCFTDLAGFTSAFDGCEPELVAKILDEYLSDMATIAQAWNGMVDKFMGDGIMIIFGAFQEDEDKHSEQAVKMALAMQHRMEELNLKWEKDGFAFKLGLRIGINTGFATVGSIGPRDRRSFTAIGSTVNIASRLEKLCPPNKILIGHDTRIRLRNDLFICRPCEQFKIRGISRNILVYEIDPQLYTEEQIFSDLVR